MLIMSNEWKKKSTLSIIYSIKMTTKSA